VHQGRLGKDPAGPSGRAYEKCLSVLMTRWGHCVRCILIDKWQLRQRQDANYPYEWSLP